MIVQVIGTLGQQHGEAGFARHERHEDGGATRIDAFLQSRLARLDAPFERTRESFAQAGRRQQP